MATDAELAKCRKDLYALVSICPDKLYNDPRYQNLQRSTKKELIAMVEYLTDPRYAEMRVKEAVSKATLEMSIDHSLATVNLAHKMRNEKKDLGTRISTLEQELAQAHKEAECRLSMISTLEQELAQARMVV